MTGLLRVLHAGDPDAFAASIPLVYSELNRLAQGYPRRDWPGHTPQPTALVAEAFLELCGASGDIEDRYHFIALAACNMRQILVDDAPARSASERAEVGKAIAFDESLFADEQSAILIELNAALTQLEKLDPRTARPENDRRAPRVSISTVARDLRGGLPWLALHLS